jgi:hypothetical protein
MEWFDTLSFDREFLANKINDNLFTLHKLVGSNIKNDALNKRGFLWAADRMNSRRVGSKLYYFSRTLRAMYDYIYSLDERKRNFYEIILKDRPCKVFLDIELDDPTPNQQSEINTMIEETVERIKNFLNLIGKYSGAFEHMILDSSRFGKKVSKHIIINGPVFRNIDEHLKHFMHKYVADVWEKKFDKRVLDINVYNGWRCFRLVDNTKLNQTRFLRYDKHIDFDMWKKMLVNVQNDEPSKLIEFNIAHQKKISRKRKFRESSNVRFTELCSFIEDNVLAFIGERGKVRIDSIKLSETNTVVSIRFQRLIPTECCYISKYNCEAPVGHQSNGFSININLFPGTVMMYCYGTHENKEMRLNIDIPDEIIKKAIKEANVILPTKYCQLNVIENIYVHGCILIGIELKDGFTYYYYKINQERCLRTNVCHYGKIEIRKRNETEAATSRCLHFGCNVTETIRLKKRK